MNNSDNNNQAENNNFTKSTDINNNSNETETIPTSNTQVPTTVSQASEEPIQPIPTIPVTNEPVNPADLVTPVSQASEEPTTEAQITNEQVQQVPTINQIQQPIQLNQVPSSEPLNVNTELPSIENFQQPPQQPIKNNTNKTSIFIVVGVVIVVLLVGGYFLFNKPSSTNQSKSGNNCTEIKEIEGSGKVSNVAYIEKGDTQYIFESINDWDIITLAFEFDEVKTTICYKNVNNSEINFHAGKTTKTKKIESMQFYDTKTKKKISSKSIDEFLIDLGYHSFGKHTEKAKVNEKGDYPTSGYADGKTYSIYNLEIELSSGKTIQAIYNVYKNQENKIDQLEKGKTYTFDFEVKKGTFNPIVYEIIDFK